MAAYEEDGGIRAEDGEGDEEEDLCGLVAWLRSEITMTQGAYSLFILTTAVASVMGAKLLMGC